MPRLLLLIAAIFLLWYFIQYVKALQHKPPKERQTALWRTIFIGLFGLTLVLVLTGRAHWLAAAFAGFIPFAKNFAGLLIRAVPLLKIWQRNGGPQVGPTLKTPSLEIKVNISNGSIDGKVLSGVFEGQTLSSLNKEQLDQLLSQLHNDDAKGAKLLRAYMARRFHSNGGEYQQRYSQTDTDTAASEAWQILGLKEGANKDEIIQAHKRLIQKLHPDRGGNDYLAAKINGAKDTLLKNS